MLAWARHLAAEEEPLSLTLLQSTLHKLVSKKLLKNEFDIMRQTILCKFNRNIDVDIEHFLLIRQTLLFEAAMCEIEPSERDIFLLLLREITPQYLEFYISLGNKFWDVIKSSLDSNGQIEIRVVQILQSIITSLDKRMVTHFLYSHYKQSNTFVAKLEGILQSNNSDQLTYASSSPSISEIFTRAIRSTNTEIKCIAYTTLGILSVSNSEIFGRKITAMMLSKYKTENSKVKLCILDSILCCRLAYESMDDILLLDIIDGVSCCSDIETTLILTRSAELVANSNTSPDLTEAIAKRVFRGYLSRLETFQFVSQFYSAMNPLANSRKRLRVDTISKSKNLEAIVAILSNIRSDVTVERLLDYVVRFAPTLIAIMAKDLRLSENAQNKSLEAYKCLIVDVFSVKVPQEFVNQAVYASFNT